jgi:hypothetical protein
MRGRQRIYTNRLADQALPVTPLTSPFSKVNINQYPSRRSNCLSFIGHSKGGMGRVLHFNQFVLMHFRPLADWLAALFRQAAFNDIQVRQLHHRWAVTILDMNMARRMLAVNQKHPDDDSIEPADFRHWLYLIVGCGERQQTASIAENANGAVRSSPHPTQITAACRVVRQL